MARVTTFERVWNSTLGVPQQLFLRTLRAIQRDDVDLFSHRGILDWSLVPIAGIWDDGEDRQDVGFEEAFDLTFGKLGAPKNWATELGANILTDPLNLLTGGLTATAKTARSAQNALRVSEVQAALSGLGDAKKTIGGLRQAVDEVLKGKHGIVTGSRRSLLQRAKKQLDAGKVGDEMETINLLAKGSDQELRFGMPSLIGRGALQWRTPEYSSWLKFAKDKTPGVGAAVGFLKPAFQSSDGTLRPVLRDLADKWAAIKGGSKTAALNFETGKYARLSAGRQRVPLDGINRKMYDKTLANTTEAASRFAAEYERNQDTGRALSVALGMTKPGARVKTVFDPTRVDEVWRNMRGKSAKFYDPKSGETPLEWAKRNFEEFRADYDETTGAFREAIGPTAIETPAGMARRKAIESGNLTLFNAARKLKRAGRKLFISDVSSEKIIEAERSWRTTSAQAQDQIEEIIAQGGEIMAQVSKELGVPPEMLARIAVTAMDGVAPAEELKHWRMLAEINAGDAGFAKSAESFAERQLASVDGLIAYLRDFQETPLARDLLTKLEALAKDGIKGRTITATFDKLAEVSDLLRPDLKAAAGNGAGANVLVSAASRARGEYLAFLPNHRLRQIARDLHERLALGKAGRFDDTFVEEMLDLYPDVKEIWKKTNMSIGDFTKTMTGLRGVTEIAERLAELQKRAGIQTEILGRTALGAERATKAAEETVAATAHRRKRFIEKGSASLDQANEALGFTEEGLAHASQQLESAKTAKALAEKIRKRAAKNKPALSTIPNEDVFDVTATKYRAWEEQEKYWLKQVKKWSDAKKLLTNDIKTLEKAVKEESRSVQSAVRAAKFTAKQTAADYGRQVAAIEKAVAGLDRTIATMSKDAAEQVAEARARLGVGQEDMRTLLSRQAQTEPVFKFEGYKHDISKIEAVLRRRAAGEEVWRAKPKTKRVTTPTAYRDILDIAIEPSTNQILSEMGTTFEEVANRVAQLGLPRVEQGDMIDGALGLLVTSSEIKRLATKFPKETLPPTLIDKAIGYAMKSSAAVEDAMFSTMGKKGAAYLEHIRYLRGQVHATSAALGNIVSTSPLGYIGHVLTREHKLALKAAFGEDGIGTLMDTGAPRLAASMRRRLDSLSLHELNSLHRELVASGGERGKKTLALLDSIAKDLGYEKGFTQFETDPLLALTTRLAQNKNHLNASDFIRFAEEQAGDDLLLGRVARVVQAGEKISVGKVRRLELLEEGAAEQGARGGSALTPVQGQRAKGGRVKTGGPPTPPKGLEEAAPARGQSKFQVVEDDLNVAEIEGVVIEHHGDEVFVPSYAIGNGTAIMDIGRPQVGTLSADEIKFGGAFDAADAFALRTMRGTISERDFIRGGISTFGDMKNRLAGEAGELGSFVAFGNEELLTSVVSAIQNQWKNPGAFLAMVDSVDYFLRKAATIWRPAFVIGNQASYIGQTGILVKSPRSIVGGYADAVRFMAQDNKLNAIYDPVVHALAEPGQLRMGFDPMSVARRGPVDPDMKVLEKFGLSKDDIVYRLGDGTEISRGDVLRALRDVMISHTREGLRGTGRVSRTAEEVAKIGARRATKAGRAKEELTKFLEGSEALPRLATVFAQLREGVGLHEAIENALMVHVNYADLTNFERSFAKRVLGFYTFTRKFAPVAFKELSRNPAHASMLAQLSKQSGFVREENGKPRFVVGPASFDMSRLNPVMEALHMSRFTAQVFGEVAGPAEVQQQDELTGRQRSPFQFGPTASAAFEAVAATRAGGVGEGLTTAASDIGSWMWPVRVALDYGDGDENTSPLDTFWSQVAPATANKPEYRKDVIRRRYAHAISELRKKYNEATDKRDRAAYEAEANRLQGVAEEIIKGIK